MYRQIDRQTDKRRQEDDAIEKTDRQTDREYIYLFSNNDE